MRRLENDLSLRYKSTSFNKTVILFVRRNTLSLAICFWFSFVVDISAIERKKCIEIDLWSLNFLSSIDRLLLFLSVIQRYFYKDSLWRHVFKLNKVGMRSGLKSSSHLSKKTVLLQWKPFKNDDLFLFHLESSSLFQDILIFILTFWSCRKNSLIRKKSWFQNLCRHNQVNKQLQYIYCPIFHEVKATKEWNLVS